MYGTVISINPNDEISIKADQKVFELYVSSMEKNGRLNAYNEIRTFSKNLLEERNRALDKVWESEKWFKKKIEFLDEFKSPYRVGKASEKDKNRITELMKSYPELNGPFDLMDNYDMWGSFKLSSMLNYIDTNKDFFEKVDMVDLTDTGEELYEAILQFDFINVLHERSKDLAQLLIEGKFDGKIKKFEFVRSLKEIKEKKNNVLKPGPKVPEELLNDIRDILEIILDPEDSLYDEDLERDMTDQNGKLIISRVVTYAEDYPYFAMRWVNEDARLKEGGYSKRSLKKHFSNVYEEI